MRGRLIFSLLKTVASRLIGTHGENASTNAVGISPDWSGRLFQKLDVRQVGGASTSFDFVWTYSARRNVEPLAAAFQSNEVRRSPNAEEANPLTSAAKAAWASTHRKQARCPLGELRASRTMRMASQSSKMKTDRSPGILFNITACQLGRWSDTTVLVSPVKTAGTCP